MKLYHNPRCSKSRQALSLLQARERKHDINWASYTPPAPSFLGNRIFDDIDLAVLRDYIDWMPFFNAWEFHGKFPQILEDDTVGEAATSLYRDATAMLDTIIDEKWLTARAVLGFHRAVIDAPRAPGQRLTQPSKNVGQ